MAREVTITGGRDATTAIIPGDICLAVGMPNRQPPSGWSWHPLAKTARLESGHTPSRRHPEYWGGDIPWIGIRDATANHGRVICETNEYTNTLGIANSSARLLPKDTVCLSRTASVGYVVVMGRPMATSQDFVNWVCSDELNPHFLKYALLSETRALRMFAVGSVHPTIYFPEVKAFYICAPDRPEQDQIADVLCALDNKIELNRRVNETLEAMARAIFKDWFVEFGPTRAKMEGRVAYLAPEVWALFPDRLDDQGKPIGWIGSPIKSSCSKIANGGTPKRDVAAYWDGGTIPWLTSSEVRKPYLIGTDSFITEAGLEASSAKWVDPDATVVALYGATAGQVSYVATHLTTNQAVCALTPKPTFRYFNYLLLSSSTQTLAGMATGSAQQNLSKGLVEELPTIFGDLDVMQHFDAALDPCFKRIIANEREAVTLSATRDLLLPKLMSGEIRIKDAERIVEAAF